MAWNPFCKDTAERNGFMKMAVYSAANENEIGKWGTHPDCWEVDMLELKKITKCVLTGNNDPLYEAGVKCDGKKFVFVSSLEFGNGSCFITKELASDTHLVMFKTTKQLIAVMVAVEKSAMAGISAMIDNIASTFPQ